MKEKETLEPRYDMYGELMDPEEVWEWDEEEEYAPQMTTQEDQATIEAQKTDQMLSSQEKTEEKLEESFSEAKVEQVKAAGGAAPEEPKTVTVTKKFEAISGADDKDYDNVMETWNIYLERFQGLALSERINQLKNVETNASRYTRWKLTFFMDKKGVKYKRYQQMKDLEKHAIKLRKELEKEVAEKKAKGTYKEDDDKFVYDGGVDEGMRKVFEKRSMPMRILTGITGMFTTLFQKIGRKIFAVQNESDYRNTYVLDSYHYSELQAEFLEGLFRRKGNKDAIHKRGQADFDSTFEDMTDEKEMEDMAVESAVEELRDLEKDLKQQLNLSKKKELNKAEENDLNELSGEIEKRYSRLQKYNKTAPAGDKIDLRGVEKLSEEVRKNLAKKKAKK